MVRLWSVAVQVVLAGLMVVTPTGSVQAASQIEGVWLCFTGTPAVPTNVPTYITFHADGTVTFSSGTTLSTLGFANRGSGYGEWRKTGTNEWSVRAVELLHNFAGELAGRLFLDSLVTRDPATDRLCSGGLSCPSQTNNVKITSMTISGGQVMSEVDLSNTTRVSTCERLSVSFPSIP
jgi:hypothetical protein